VVSCVDKLPDYPVPLDTPIAELINVDATNKSKLVFSWPDVEDSDGFEFTLYEVDGEYTALGAVPTVVGIIGEEKQVVHGTSVERPQKDSTYYKIELRVLGDKKNRSNAQRASSFHWDNAPRKLATPTAGQITIDAESDPNKLTFSWANVERATGFEFSLYKTTGEGENEVLEPVGIEGEIITGTSIERPQEPSTYYKIVLKVLGDPNTYIDGKLYLDGIPTVRYWDNIPVEVIPTKTNLTEFFATNPISGEGMMLFVLDEFGEYTMNGNIALGTTPVVIRGKSKAAPAKITITDGSFVNSGSGFRLENLEIDYTNFVTDKEGVNNLNNNALVLMSSTHPDGAILDGNGFLVVPAANAIVLQSIKVKGLLGYLFYDNNQKYALETLTINDCIIGMNTDTWNQPTFNFLLSLVRDFTINNSTVYNEKAPSNSSNRFMRFGHGNYSTQVEEWADGGSMTITNCTFWQAGKGAQSFNSNNAMGRPQDLVTVQRNVFVDSYENGRIIARFRRGSTTAQFVGGQNTQWYDGANFTGTQDSNATSGDTDRIETDPGLTYIGNGSFTMTGAEQIANRTGDPRWLP